MVSGLGLSGFQFSPEFQLRELQQSFGPPKAGGEAEAVSADTLAKVPVDDLSRVGQGSVAEVAEQFGATLRGEMDKLNTVQTQANQLVEDYATGKEVALHQVMIGMNRADLSLQLATQVRNRLVSAYQDVSRMPI